MADLKILQINLGKGCMANECMRRFARLNGVDVVMVQEPYHKRDAWDEWKWIGCKKKGKVAIWIRESLPAVARNDLLSEGTCAVTTGGLLLICIYAQPGGTAIPVLNRIDNAIRTWDGPIIVAGDFNAKHQAWGGVTTDARGELLLEWLCGMDMFVANDNRSLATFSSSNGESWVDVTVCKRVNVQEWEVLEEDTLSDHRYIVFAIRGERPRERGVGATYDLGRARWNTLHQIIGTFRMDVDEDAETLAGRFQTCLEEACRVSIPRARRKNGRANEWWNADLEREKRIVNRKRREWQNNRADPIEARLRELYRTARRTYNRHIARAKELWVNQVIDGLGEGEPWDKVWKFLKGNEAKACLGNVQKEDGTFTLGEEETNEYLLGRHFPRDEAERDTPARRRVRERVIEDCGWNDRDFTYNEISTVIDSMVKGKAMSWDKVPNEAIHQVWECRSELLHELMNLCWNECVFPKIWKKAKVVWVPKKDGSSRPISLLPALGKLLDKLINGRVQYWCERMNRFSQGQYGFRSGRRTVDAIKSVVDTVQTRKQEGYHVLVVTLDLRNAFNMAWWPAIEGVMRHMGMPDNLRKICGSFMNERVVTVGRTEWVMERGCPQGSSLGPTLWLIAMEGWFETMTSVNDAGSRDTAFRGGCYSQAYADDEVLLVYGPSVKAIEYIWSQVWKGCSSWAETFGLEYNVPKTESLFIPARGIVREPIVRLGGNKVTCGDWVRYLGVIIDRKFLFIDHLRYVREKSGRLCAIMNGILRRRFGHSGAMCSIVYERVAKPAILYAREIWGARAHDTRCRRLLAAIQRPFLMRMVPAYRTTATVSLQIVTGTIPLEVEAKNAWSHYSGDDVDSERVYGWNKPHPSFSCRDVRARGILCCYTDASVKAEDRVGIGMVCVKNDRIIEERSERVKGRDCLSAELAAIHAGLMEIRARGGGLVLNDSKIACELIIGNRSKRKDVVLMRKLIYESVIEGANVTVEWSNNEYIKRADQLAFRAAERIHTAEGYPVFGGPPARRNLMRKKNIQTWQNDWAISEKGRLVYAWCEEVGCGNLGLNFGGLQLASGHGDFGAYLKRFGLRVNENCECGIIETRDHIMYDCELTARKYAREYMVSKYGREILNGFRLREYGKANIENVDRVNEWANLLGLNDRF